MNKVHLSALRRASGSGWVLPDDQDNVMEALLKAEFVSTDGKLTDTGRQAAEKIVYRMGQLEAGVPFAERKISEPDLISTLGPWYISKYTGKRIITNMEMWSVVACPRDMESSVVELDTDEIKRMVNRVRPVVNQMGKPLKFIEVKPTTWKVVGDLDVGEIIIFEGGDRTYTINAIYYDFIMKKHDPKGTGKITWMLSPQHPEWPLGGKTTKKAVNGFVTLIAPVNIADI